MLKVLYRNVRNRPVYIFGEPKPESERNRWRDPDLRGPLPDSPLRGAGRISLTRPSSPRPAGSGDTAGAQKCLLDALPLEIRQQIWELVVGEGWTFHLFMVEKQLRAPECLSPDPGTCNGGCRHLCGPRTNAGRAAPKKFLLPLLLTCRQIYEEAIDYLYSSNVFETHNPDTLEFLPLLLLPQRINSIRSLAFTWRFRRYPPIGRLLDSEKSYREDQDIRQASWTTIWHNIAAMQNLQYLEVKLDVRDGYWGSFDPEIARVLLEPVKTVTTPEVFILTLPFAPDVTSRFRINSWSAEKSWKGIDPWEQLPCTIKRVGGNFFYEP